MTPRSHRPLRAGVVGAGLMGRWHADAMRKAGGQLIAVMDVDPRAAQNLVRKYRGVGVYANLDQLLHQSYLDVLHICTPTSTHYPIAERAIQAGVNVLVEKPLTHDATDTDRLLELATANGVKLCPTHQFIFQNGVLNSKKWLARIGRLVYMETVIHSAGGTGMTSAQLDRIALDILPHPLSLFQEFLPQGLMFVDWRTVCLNCGEFRAIGQLQDTDLSIRISMSSRPTICVFRIVGTGGRIHLDLFHGFAFFESDHVSRKRKLIYPFENAFRQFSAATANLIYRIYRWEPAYPGLRKLVNQFYHSVRMKDKPPVSQADVVAVARTRDSFMQQI